MRLQIGDRFPVEALGTDLGERDGPLVVYFYPQAGTDMCTQEAIEFNRHFEQFEEAGVGIVGVSIDPEAKNRSFATECGVRFPLVSDAEGELTERLGLMKTYGDYGDMAARVTLLVDEEGIVREIWQVEDVVSHVEEVLERSTLRT